MQAHLVDLGYFLMLCGFLARDVLYLRCILIDVDAAGAVELIRWETRALRELRERNPVLWTRVQSVIGHDLVEKIQLQEARAKDAAGAPERSM